MRAARQRPRACRSASHRARSSSAARELSRVALASRRQCHSVELRRDVAEIACSVCVVCRRVDRLAPASASGVGSSGVGRRELRDSRARRSRPQRRAPVGLAGLQALVLARQVREIPTRISTSRASQSEPSSKCCFRSRRMARIHRAVSVVPPPVPTRPPASTVANRADGGIVYWVGKLYGFAALVG